MKKALISIVLATFCLSLPVFGSARAAITTATESAQTANSSILPIFAQLRGRRRRLRRARHIALRRRERRAFRRHRYHWRHRRR